MDGAAGLHASPADAGAARLTAGEPRTDALRTPLGIDDATPTLSWRPRASGHDEAQTAYQVEVASSPGRLDDPDLWDSGKVASADPSASYAGRAPLAAAGLVAGPDLGRPRHGLTLDRAVMVGDGTPRQGRLVGEVGR